MTRGRPSHRAKRPTGWLSGSKGSSHRGKMPLWQWIVAVPVLILLLGGIALFAYLTMFNPRMGAGVRTETVLVLERVEHRASDGTLDTAGSYLLVNIDRTRLRLAPRLPDWNQVAKGDLIEVDVSGTGAAVQAFAWRTAPKRAPVPAGSAPPGAPAAPAGTPPPPR